MRQVVLTIMALSAFVMASSRTFGQPRPGGERRGPGRFHPVIRLFDANGDGVLTKDEIGKAAAKLEALDTSKDGKLTAEELRPAAGFGPGRPGRGPGGRGPSGRGPGGSGPSAAERENPLLSKDDQEKKILATLEQMRKGPRFANVSTNDGRLLRLLTETIGAKRVVEIGTSTGESAVWFALALRSTDGKLLTHEIDPERAKIAKENFKKAGVDHLISVIVGDAHETVAQHKDKEPIDILFLDADKQGYIDYLKKLVPLIRPGGLIIAHNMRYPRPDPAYLEAITKDPKLETSFLLMEGAGVGVTLKKR